MFTVEELGGVQEAASILLMGHTDHAVTWFDLDIYFLYYIDMAFASLK